MSASGVAAPLCAALLGLVLLYVVGFAQSDAIHNGAHDARHVGAPLPPPGLDSSTGEDGRAFIRATYLANTALWLALGVLVGWLGKPGKSAAMPDGHRGRDAAGVDARAPH